jgi:hypothetical protein
MIEVYYTKKKKNGEHTQTFAKDVSCQITAIYLQEKIMINKR